MKPEQDGQPPEYDWSPLVVKMVHPTRVAIVEALLRLDRPLSATELAKMLGFELSNLSYHLTSLAKLKIVKAVRKRQVRGAVETFYTLM